MTSRRKQVTVTPRLVTWNINRARILTDKNECHRGNIARPGSYAVRVASMPDRSNGLLCIECEELILLGSICMTKPTSHYSLKHYFHPECAHKLNIW